MGGRKWSRRHFWMSFTRSRFNSKIFSSHCHFFFFEGVYTTRPAGNNWIFFSLVLGVLGCLQPPWNLSLLHVNKGFGTQPCLFFPQDCVSFKRCQTTFTPLAHEYCCQHCARGWYGSCTQYYPIGALTLNGICVQFIYNKHTMLTWWPVILSLFISSALRYQ